jgi:hypothetical protein
MRFKNYIHDIPSNLTNSKLKEIYDKVSSMDDVFPMNYSPNAFYIKSSSEDKLKEVVNQLKKEYSDEIEISKITQYFGHFTTLIRKK